MKTAAKILKKGLSFVLSASMALAMAVTSLPSMPVKAAAGDTPAHTKNITDNHDGTYTISLDVVGDSEKKPNNINVIVIVDTSGSMNQQRMTAAKNAVNSLANSLYAYNTQSDPDTVEMALVRFATSSSVARTPTSNATQFRNAVNGLGNEGEGGTNWESALQTAYGVDFGDTDQTFAIFVSDGNPTFRTTQNGWNDWNRWYQQWGSGEETATNIARCYTTAVDDAEALATKVTPANFFTIGAFGNVDRMEQLTDDAGSDSSTNYYSASDTAALNQAISDILAKIEMAGIGNTEIDDGTTNQVKTTSGEVTKLLEVDESSYKYYRSGGTYGSMKPWNDAPAAELVNGTVEWDLSSVGVLENGVRYTVTFDCYPSQYTYDTIAKLKNGDITYDSLDSEIKKYIVDNGNGSYSLRTNTNATLSYDDTRDDAGQQTADYTNPDPVGTDAQTLTINKEWEGASPDVDSLPITVLMDDGTVFHTRTLSSDNDWATNAYISVGIIKNGQALPGAKGHDFYFAELDDTQYRWELDAPTVRPMLINGTLTMLIKVDEDHAAPSGAQTYTIDGATYYVDSAAGGLTATNYRRSNLNLTKVVTGEDAPDNATFPFTLTVNNSKAPATEPADDPEHNSDYWVWFSIYDTKAGATVTDATVSGATGPSASGYYYAPSGSAISVQMKDGWNLRFTNMPSGTTYTFAEGELAEGFAFNKAELTVGRDSTFKAGKTTTGTIENTGTSYAVTFTNDYELTNLEITKVWDDAKNQDGKRLTADELKAKLTLSPAVQGKEPTVVDNGDDTYTITYTGLPRFNNGEEVEYSVTEGAIDGYETTGSPAKDHGTITNKHTPEVTNVTVRKVWDDQNDIGKIRPASINAQLTADGTASGDPVALNAGNEWTYTWEKLPKYKNGKEIVYSADETAVPAGYDKTGPEKSTAQDGTVTFTVTNTYNPTPVSVDPPVQKVITGTDDLYNKGDFTFKIEAVSPADAPMPTNTSITNSADYELEGKTGFYEFGVITFTMPGTYTYKISESGTVDGVTNDKDAAGKEITFTVTDDGKGNLTVTPTTDQVQMSFTNVYDANGEASIVVNKEIAGAAWPAGKTLTLTIAGANNAPMPEETTASLTAAGSVTFGPIAYGLADAGKSYTYTITEDSLGTGWSGNPASITATVAVTDNGDGTLGTAVTYSPEDAKFTNTYKATGTATLEAVKAISGAEWPKNGEITFTLAGTDAPMPETTEVTLTEPGTAEFGPINYTEADAGKTYTYTISEDGFGTGWTGSGDITATVEVTDNGDGTLETAVTYSPENGTITNTYKAEGEIELFAGKKLNAAEGLNAPDVSGKYTLTLEAQDGAPMPEGATDGKVEITNTDGNGTMSTFGAIAFTEADAGKTYTYKVTETGTVAGVQNGTAEYTVTVTVTDNGDGTLTATASPNAETLFTNTYKVGSTTASFPVKKVLSVPEGLEGPAEWSYTINVAANDGAPEAATMTETVDQDTDTVTFGDFTYTAPGTYTYTVSETGTIAGVTNDEEAAGKTVTVTVIDNGEGELTATVSPETGVTFTNKYDVGKVSASFPVKKVLSVPEGMEGPAQWSYTIDVAANDGAPEAATMTGTVDQDTDTVTFGDFEYTVPGTYTYTVTETGTVAGVTNDSAAATGKTVTVTVADNGEGELTATVSPETGITFTNEYDAESVTASFPVKKILSVPEGMEGPAQWSYTIDVTANDGAPVAETMSGTVSKTADTTTFGPFTYTAPGTYTYTVSETGEVAGVTNDAQAAGKTVTVTVVDNKDGTLTATASSTDNSPLTFTNTYNVGSTTASFPVKKILSVPEGMEGPAEWSYTIDVTANDGAPVAETMSGTVSKTADTTTFGPFTYTAPGTYTYTVSETGTISGVTNDAEAAGKTVTVTVVDNKDGTLTATASSTDNSPLTFTNTYNVGSTTASFPVKKVMSVPEGMEGPAEWSYTINVAANAGAPEAETMTGTVTKTTDTANFGPFTYTAPGTYTYTVSETGTIAGVTNDEQAAGKTVTVTVVDNKDGTLTATASSTDNSPLTFTNTYKVGEISTSFPVKKILSVPEGMDGPAEWSYTIDVAANDGAPAAETMTGTVTKAADTTTFGPFTYTAPGTYTYTVSETGKIAGVTNDAQAAGKTVTVTVVDNKDGTLTATASSTADAPLTFTNTYDAEGTLDGTALIRKTVKAIGTAWGPKTFDFTIAAVDGAPLGKRDGADVTTGTATFKEAGTQPIDFGTFTYTAPGTYSYTIAETTQSGNGWICDNTAKTVTVIVEDNGDGVLRTKVEQQEIVNTYNADGTVVLEGTKQLFGSDEPVVLKDETAVKATLESDGAATEVPLKVALKAADEDTQLSIESEDIVIEEGGDVAETEGVIEEDAQQTVLFGAITFKKAGVYTFAAEQIVEEELEGWTYDKEEKLITVEVVSGDEQLEAVVTDNDPLFVNVFEEKEEELAEVSFQIPAEIVTKIEEDVEPVSQAFTLAIASEDENVAIEAAEITSEEILAGETGQVVFNVTAKVPVEAEELPIYSFTVSQNEQEIEGWKFNVENDAAQTVTVTINKAEAEEAVEEAEATEATEEAPVFEAVVEGKPVFVNAYSPEKEEELTEVSFQIPVEIVTKAEEDVEPVSQAFTLAIASEDENVAIEAAEITTEEILAGETDQAVFNVTAKVPAEAEELPVYSFTVSQNEQEIEGWKFNVENDAAQTVTVRINRTETEELEAVVEGKPVFVNAYGAAVEEEAAEPAEGTEEPAAEGTDTETPEAEAPAEPTAEAPVTEAPAAETPAEPAAEAPVTEAPAVEIPAAEAPVTEASAAETPAEPAAEAPVTEAPAVEAPAEPAAEAPVTEAPAVETPAEPAAEAPVTEAPAAETPAEPAEEAPVVEETVDGAALWTTGYTNRVYLEGTESLVGRSLDGGEFQFEVKYGDTVVATGTNGAAAAGEKAPITFSEIKFSTEAKEGYINVVENGLIKESIQFTVTELAAPEWYQENTQTFTVNVSIKDNGDGTLSASPAEGTEIAFVNYYITDVAKVSVDGTKEMVGRPLAEGEYTFDISVSPEGPLPETTSAANDANGGFSFGEITFGQADLGEDGAEKTYTYTITESGQYPGVTNDPEPKTFTVTISDNGEGKIIAKTSGLDDGIKFINTYTSEPVTTKVTTDIPVSKKLTGRTLKEGEFTFELKDADGNVVSTASNDANGKVEFGELTFDKVGAYKYTINEVSGSLGGVTYDGNLYDATANVTEKLDENGKYMGQLECKWTNSGGLTEITFVNTYVPSPVQVGFNVKKTLTGRELKAGEFTFKLTDSDGNVDTAVNKADGTIEFPAKTFRNAGTYTYTVTEVNDGKGGITYDTSPKTITVTVTDDEKGHLLATVSPESVTFANAYAAAGTRAVITAQKVMNGRTLQNGEFTFILRDSDGNTVAEATNAADGSVAFGAIEYDKAGEYNYTIVERTGGDSAVTYDTSTKNVTVSVIDNGDGTMTATVTGNGQVFMNRVQEDVVPPPYIPDPPTPPVVPTIIPPTPVTPQVLGESRVLGAQRAVLGARRGVLGANRTGDDRHMTVWLVVMVSGIATLIGYILFMVKRKKNGKA